jgi:restriction endonuclease
VRLQCESCGLRLASFHFKEKGLINPKLRSICDICLERGLSAEDYANDVIATFAQALLYGYRGKAGTGEHNFIVKGQKQRKSYEAFMQDFDSNEVASGQIDRSELNQAIIKSEDGKLDFIPQGGTEFSKNLAGLGLKVNFQLNEVDYINRERIRAKYKYICQYCGRPGRSVDHKDPVSLSHNNDLDNLILSCSECNRIKSDMPYDLFVKLNKQVEDLNKKLVRYDASLRTLKEEFEHRRRYLAGQVHLKGVVNDPELNAIRKENKRLQDAIDSLESDYDAIRHLRENHFTTGWKLALVAKKDDIV